MTRALAVIGRLTNPRWLDIWWTRFRLELTADELRRRSADGSLSPAQAANYLHQQTLLDQRLQALLTR